MADLVDHCYSGYNSAANTNRGWPNWSPVIGFLRLSPEEEEEEEEEDLYNLMRGMASKYSDDYPLAVSSPEKLDHLSSSSSGAATPTEEPLNLSSAGEAYKEARLIHLLAAAAESLTGDNFSGSDSAAVIAASQLLRTLTANQSIVEARGGFTSWTLI